MRHSINIIFSLVSLFCFTTLQAQDFKTISAKKQQKDWKQLKHLIEAHPDPYRHHTEAFVQGFINDKIESAVTEIDELLFYKQISQAIALLKDGHTSVYLSENFEKSLRDSYGMFPLKVYLNNQHELYVIDTYDDSVTIPKGSRILSINGVSVDSFITAVDPYVSYERQAFRNVVIQHTFNDCLWLHFGRQNAYDIEYSSLKTEQVSVSNMKYKDWKSATKAKRDEREKQMVKGRPYAYETLDEKTGIIKIFSFSVESLEKYDFFLNKTFKEIAENDIKYLIIDVRGNFGGWPKISSELFHRISNQYFKTTAASQLKVSVAYRDYFKTRYPDLVHHLVNNHYTSSIHGINIMAVMKEKIGQLVTETDEFNEPPSERNYEFEGKVFLLTDRNSYSAASNFAATFKCYQMGTIIGEETGGTHIFHANAFNEKLGGSQFSVRMASTKVFATCYDQADDGIKPHIAFSPSTIDVINDFDSQLNYALRIIKKIEKELKE